MQPDVPKNGGCYWWHYKEDLGNIITWIGIALNYLFYINLRASIEK